MQVVFAHAAHKVAIVAAWAVNVGLTNASLYAVGSSDYWWINAVYVCLLGTSYESERHHLRHFVKVSPYLPMKGPCLGPYLEALV